MTHPIMKYKCPKCKITGNAVITSESSVENYIKWTTVANERVKRKKPIQKDNEGYYIDYCWFCFGIVKGFIQASEEDLISWKNLNNVT